MKISIVTPTHKPVWLKDAWDSLLAQTDQDFEWVIVVNDGKGRKEVTDSYASTAMLITRGDPRVKVLVDPAPHEGVGARKKIAFGLATGDVLVELDHDDMLTAEAVAEVRKAFEDESVGFAYSDFIDFEDGTHQGAVTYRNPNVRAGWVASGYSFYEAEVSGSRPGSYECVRAFPPTAMALSYIYWAPNHLRAWRRSVYEAVGGHDPSFKLCDDHDLVVRTYLATKPVVIRKPLYLYRVSKDNTWSKNVVEIGELTRKIRDAHLERLILREAELAGAPVIDLVLPGDAPREGWQSSEVHGWSPTSVSWPWEDGSIGAFRASDVFQHVPGAAHAMSEAWRCLRPGGWLLAAMPSTDGRGAFQDPMAVSRWNQNTFWSWTRSEAARRMPDKRVRFQEADLFTRYPTEWHQDNLVSYVYANLIALKSGYQGPGEKKI